MARKLNPGTLVVVRRAHFPQSQPYPSATYMLDDQIQSGTILVVVKYASKRERPRSEQFVECLHGGQRIYVYREYIYPIKGA